MRRTALLTSALLFSITAHGQPQSEEIAPPGLPEPDLPTAGPQDQEAIEPEVTIIRRQDRTVEEYRINNQLYMIKVTPRKGVPYYLMDSDGDGSLETRRNELDPHLLVPSWIIFSW
ncbi:hypothetical protein TspCOW1_23770 [Thiohalobacter sp. COW1]|uniref:DUF2782 domain-containing protein n=1 Tax=Thiohalobacter thiocyanaticus TaxID=585455 RepID=A0A1Z4VME2_9GAMM|nr:MULTISPECIES: DUF2782 domain-containing protein [Thiohalobacter]BAZ92767.1 uncharacterized protein FOKN1_0363 [Thiohalobacter thiocyanaticus]BCO32274.1 hypothetical protein TspCOW1_23770 [Thiohalobacter sp. COW1]